MHIVVRNKRVPQKCSARDGLLMMPKQGLSDIFTPNVSPNYKPRLSNSKNTFISYNNRVTQAQSGQRNTVNVVQKF